MEPRLEYATARDGVRIAWTANGAGPAVVYLPGVPFSDFQAEWRIPVLRRAFERLGEHVRLVQFDGRGTGHSQRDVTDVSLDAYLQDLDAVLEAAGVREAVLLGFYHSALHAVAWGARHPERTRGLVLFGGTLRGWESMSGRGTQALLSLIELDWDTFVKSVVHAWLGWPDDAQGRLAVDWFRTSTSPTAARAVLQAASGTDVTADAVRNRCPALVLHRRDAPVIPLAASVALADALPGGRLVQLPGTSASLFFEGADEIVDRVTRFATDPSAPDPPSRPLSPGPAGELSARETEVLRRLAGGDTNHEIAARLGVSVNTVERHVSNIYRKLDVRGRSEATAWAIRRGLG